MADEYVVNVEGATYRDGEYLLARRSEAENHAAGTWSLIGGKVEGIPRADDVLVETLAREIHEEVGVEVADATYVTASAFVDDVGRPVVNVVYLCRYDGGTPRVREPEEVAEVEWIAPGDFERIDLPSFTLDYLEAIDRRRRHLGW